MTSLSQKITKSLLKIPATQLTEVEVKAISFVPHGANQAPFKILKSEDVEKQQTEEVNMINLGELFARFKSDDEITVPTVAAVIIQKDGKNVEALKEAIKAEGFSVDNVEERDGALVLKQVDEFDLDKLQLYKSNDEILIGVVNVEKAFDPWSSSTNFSENLQKNSFLPGLHLASQVMNETAFEILVSADKSEDFKELLEKSALDFASHVVSLAANIPAAAFKLEAIKVDKAEVKEDAKKQDTEGEGQEKVNKEDVAKTDELAKEPKAEDVASVENVDLGSLMDTATESMTKAIEAMSVKFSETNETLTASIKVIGERLEKLEGDTKANAKKAEEDLNNAVLGSGINYDSGSYGTEKVDVNKTNDKAEYSEEFWETAIATD